MSRTGIFSSNEASLLFLASMEINRRFFFVEDDNILSKSHKYRLNRCDLYLSGYAIDTTTQQINDDIFCSCCALLAVILFDDTNRWISKFQINRTNYDAAQEMAHFRKGFTSVSFPFLWTIRLHSFHLDSRFFIRVAERARSPASVCVLSNQI